MGLRRVLFPVLAAAVLAVSACSAPAPVTEADHPTTDPAPGPTRPAWYGTDFDENGCPVPAKGADLDVWPDAQAFLQTDALSDDWCFYSTISYIEYYAIPKVPTASWGTDVRDALEPYAWSFDPIDDDSPDWSWINDYPSGSEAGFTDGEVSGAIVVVDAATSEDIRLKHDYFITLATGFGGDWKEGDEIRVLGFW